MEEHGTGVLQSVGSTRMYDFEMLAGNADVELPKSYIVPYIPTILDQGQVGSCVAHSVAECLQANQMKNKNDDTLISVLMIYGLWRNHLGSGMFPETTLKLGRETGTTNRQIAPENVEVPKATKLANEYLKEYPNSLGYTVGSYFKIRHNVHFEENIKKALYTYNLPVMMIWDIYPGSKHAEIIIGWEEDGKALVQNSWGETWGSRKNGLHGVEFDKIEEAYLILMDEVKLPFTDVEGHWAEKYIRNGYFANIYSGRTETTFEPEGSVKRGEMAKIIDHMMKSYDEKIFALEEEIRELKKQVR